jgi:hypothetical protein
MNRQLGALRRPRPEAYTAPVSPLIPLPPVRAKRPPTSGAVLFWYLVFCVGLVGLAATGQGVLLAVWLLVGWGVRAGTRATATA